LIVPSAPGVGPLPSPARGGLSICKIWDGDYPWDVRAEKVAAALTQHGHHVGMVARNRGRRPAIERLPEATIYRLEPWPWAPVWLDSASTFPAFFNPRWLRAIERTARRLEADLILCRDLPLAPAAIAVGEHLGRPVILDMAENYPAMLRSRRATGRARPLDWLVRNPTFARRVEGWVLSRVAGVFVMVEESRDRLIAEGVRKERIAVVSNTPPLSRLSGPMATHGEGPLQVVYLGLIEAQRGIETVLEALALLKQEHFRIHLTIIGGGLESEVFRDRARHLGLDQSDVEFTGQLPNQLALEMLPKAHVGLVPHWKDESWDTTVPNKLFDYMAAGLVVVTSNAAPAARIVTAADAGRVYADRDPVALAAALRSLQDPVERSRLARGGRQAILDNYHWEADVARMLALLEAVRR